MYSAGWQDVSLIVDWIIWQWLFGSGSTDMQLFGIIWAEGKWSGNYNEVCRLTFVNQLSWRSEFGLCGVEGGTWAFSSAPYLLSMVQLGSWDPFSLGQPIIVCRKPFLNLVSQLTYVTPVRQTYQWTVFHRPFPDVFSISETLLSSGLVLLLWPYIWRVSLFPSSKPKNIQKWWI